MFRYESELVESMVKWLKEGDQLEQFVSSAESYEVFTEVGLGHGVADIVVTEIERKICDRKKRLDSFQVMLMRIISSNNGLTLAEIAIKTRAAKKRINDALAGLEDEGFIRLFEDNYFLAREYEKVAKKSIAIEAKLKNWKRALKQAYRYKWFSELSYVCLPSSNIGPAKTNIDEFKRLEVGLVSYDDDNKFDFIYTPPPAQPFDADMTVLLSEHALTSICSFG
ncbi:hypothetical protein [Maridesulfovibrio sp.]|uniref:hypothetical protein n=1 Tax=Maridesulfovibrio sp. TaxID=2795000 RepID=UPI003AFF62DC